MGGLDRLPTACSESFQNLLDPSGRGYLGAWLYFMGSVSVAGFIKLLLPFLRGAEAAWWAPGARPDGSGP